MAETILRTIWEHNAAAYGNETAVVCDGRRTTFGQLAERAKRLGAALYDLGLRPQDRVAMLSMNADHYLDYYCACEYTGFIAATVNFRLAAPEIEYILNDATPRVLFFESQYRSLVESLRERLESVVHFICIGDDDTPDWAMEYHSLLASGSPEGAPSRPLPADIAYLIYTSGTTGKPKGCILGQAEQLHQARLIAESLQMGPASSTLLVMPLFHIGAKALQQGQHRAAGTVHVQRVFDPVALFKTVEAERITHLHLAPVMVQALIEHPDIADYDLSSLRCVCYSAAPMPEPVLRQGIKLLGPIFVQLWGQTECSGTVLPAIFHRPDGNALDRKRLVSIGHPMQETEIRLVDDDGHEVPPGAAGEMVLKGPVMMRGYWNNSAATVEALRGGWLRTGDIGRRGEDGLLYLVDRKKDVIISGGENIYSREVEDALVQLAEIAECAVLGVAHKQWGEAVCAVIAKRPGSTLSAEDVVAHCRNRIAAYKRPRFVVFIDELPKLPSGKISKVELRRRYGTGTGLREVGR